MLDIIILASILATIIAIGVAYWVKHKDEFNTETECKVSKAEVMEEMCQLGGMVRRIMRPVKHMSGAESNILLRKLYFGRKAFPVKDNAKKDEINKWLKNQWFNTPVPDPCAVDMAASSSVDTRTMERILRKVYGGDYDTYFKIAKMRVASKRGA